MSELKYYKLFNSACALTSPNFISIVDFGINAEIYIKSEADKVIAKLKESVKKLILDNYLKDKEIRHHKYRRCLAMADKCVDLCNKARDLCRWAEDENLAHHYDRKVEFFARWHNRWLKLAEKFNPNNSTAQ